MTHEQHIRRRLPFHRRHSDRRALAAYQHAITLCDAAIKALAESREQLLKALELQGDTGITGEPYVEVDVIEVIVTDEYC